MALRTTITRSLAVAGLLAALAGQVPAAASARPGTTTATAAVAAQVRTAPPAAPAQIDDAMRLAVLVRNEIARRHEAANSDVFASVDGLELHLPGREVVVIGYHEARAEHLALQPRDRDALVMPSRGREGTPTSAVDVVMPAGEDVLSPISGRVVMVADYLLYDEHQDTMIEIVPDGRPDLVVTLYHVSGASVREGQHVDAGDVIADSARVFDFVAQVEQWGRGPHVDIRVRGD